MVPGQISSVQTTLAPGMSVAQGVFFEMFLTAQLTFTVLMLAAEKSKDTFIAPIGIGISLFVAEIAGTHIQKTRQTRHWASHTDMIGRCILHWCIPQPSSQLRSMRCSTWFPRLPLDLLDRSILRCCPRRRVLCFCQVHALRGSQPRSRRCPGRHVIERDCREGAQACNVWIDRRRWQTVTWHSLRRGRHG